MEKFIIIIIFLGTVFVSCNSQHIFRCLLLLNEVVSPAQRQQQMKKPVTGTAIAIINPTTATAKIPA